MRQYALKDKHGNLITQIGLSDSIHGVWQLAFNKSLQYDHELHEKGFKVVPVEVMEIE